MQAVILWTTSDFPVYVMLFRWSSNGKITCLSYNKETWPLHLRKSKKYFYMGHCHFLSINHNFEPLQSIFAVCKSIEWCPNPI